MASMAFVVLGIELGFEGEGVHEIGSVVRCIQPEFQLPIGKEDIKVDPSYFRHTEVDLLVGNPTKAKTKLGWEPEYTLSEMVESDLKLMEKEPIFRENGYNQTNHFE